MIQSMTEADSRLPVLIVEGARVLDHLHLLMVVLIVAVVLLLHLVDRQYNDNDLNGDDDDKDYEDDYDDDYGSCDDGYKGVTIKIVMLVGCVGIMTSPFCRLLIGILIGL